MSVEGTPAAVSADERGVLEEGISLGWRPRALERASDATETGLCEFGITERTGLQYERFPEGRRRRF